MIALTSTKKKENPLFDKIIGQVEVQFWDFSQKILQQLTDI
jgi:hypothetical protein